VTRKGSFCRSFPFDAKLGFYFYVQNPGSSAVTLNLLPVRRYSDGSTNSSPMDELTIKAAPGRSGWHALFDYNPQAHLVLSCALLDVDSNKTVQLRVRG